MKTNISKTKEQMFDEVLKNGGVICNQNIFPFQSLLTMIVNKKLLVSICNHFPRNDFEGFSIQGTIEQHSENENCYRIVHTNGTYLYFTTTQVKGFFIRENLFQDGSKIVILIKQEFQFFVNEYIPA